jgi:Domain of unknown function (DUF397)
MHLLLVDGSHNASICVVIVCESPRTIYESRNNELRMLPMVPQPNLHSMLTWRKSSASGASGGCVEVAKSESFVLVRDSHNRSGAVLHFTPVQWLGLLRSVRNGRDSPSH